jgi:phosphatidylglycerophosphatase C
MSKTLALFDFDGTISRKDTLLDFIQFSFSKRKILSAGVILSPILALYASNLIDNSIAKQHVYKFFFSGMSIEKIKDLGKCYTEERLGQIIRPLGMERIMWHKHNNHQIVIVSASTEYWIKPWSEKMGLSLISTKLEIIENKLTGNFSGKNCHGEEKVKRIRDFYDLDKFENIYAYGDSDGDKQMLKIANKSFYKPFR